MAHATSFDPAPPPEARPASRNDRLVVVGADRSKQFAKARTHTFMVKTLRRVFPVLTVIAFGVYAASAMMSADFGSGLALRTIARILPENLTMNNPYYEGFTDDGGSYIVRAQTAQQDLNKLDRIKLNGITGVMTDANKSKTNLKAAHGIYDTRRSSLTLRGGIDVDSDDGLKAKLKTASIYTKRGIIVSKEPVQVNMKGGQVNSDTMRIQQKEKIITFAQNVRTKLIPEKPDPNSAEAASAPATPNSQTAMLGSSDAPIDIDSARLVVNRGAGEAVFNGNVKAVQADQTLQTASLLVKFQEKAPAAADAAAEKSSATALPDASRIELITAPEPVIMTRGELEQLTGQSAVFDAKNQTAAIKGNVVMSSGPDRKAFAELAEIDSKSDTILLTGSVVVSQGDNELRGERLFVDRTTGNSEMTAPKDDAGNGGRIFAKLRRQIDPAAGDRKGAADNATSDSAPAKDAGAFSALSATAFKGDPKAPVDIEADRLDVDDSKKEAIFSGNVLVEQGPMSLSTLKLYAYYSGEANLVGTEPAPATSGAQPTAGGGTELTRIKAKGEVFVQSRIAGQSAKGDWADIDMKANTVLLGGDVVLNQGKNVVRATSLKIDLTTGNALVETSPNETVGGGWGSTTVPNITVQKKGRKRGKEDDTVPLSIIRGNRPSAVFYPTQIGNKKKSATPQAAPAKPAKPAAQPRPSAASSWEATTETPTN